MSSLEATRSTPQLQSWERGDEEVANESLLII
jgi:hypothetical protein